MRQVDLGKRVLTSVRHWGRLDFRPRKDGVAEDRGGPADLTRSISGYRDVHQVSHVIVPIYSFTSLLRCEEKK